MSLTSYSTISAADETDDSEETDEGDETDDFSDFGKLASCVFDTIDKVLFDFTEVRNDDDTTDGDTTDGDTTDDDNETDGGCGYLTVSAAGLRPMAFAVVRTEISALRL